MLQAADQIAQNTETPAGVTAEAAVELAKMLLDHHGGDVAVLDMRQLNFWTDFFVIATVTSNTHLQGLERHAREFSRERGLEILRRSRKPDLDDEWSLLDFGGMVVHLMTARTRTFYELERLWSAAPFIFGEPPKKDTTPQTP